MDGADVLCKKGETNMLKKILLFVSGYTLSTYQRLH